MGSYLLFLGTIPLGELSLGGGWLSWITPTKIGFLVLMGGVVVAVAGGWRPRWRPAIVFPLGLMGLGVTLSAAASDDPSRSWLYAARLVAMAALCAATAAIAERGRRNTERLLFPILWTMFGIGCALALLGTYQTLTGTTIGSAGVYGDFGRMIELYLPAKGGGVSVTRASATFDHPNLFGAFMAGTIPAGILLYACGAQRRCARAAIGAGVVLCVAAAVYTFSRGAWIGTALGAALLATWRRARVPALALPALGALLAVCLLPAGARAILWNRGSAVQSYDAGRLHSFRVAGRMIAAHPILGVGPGRFDAAFDEYGGRRAEIRQSRLHSMDAHNTWLDLGAEAGLATALPFMALVCFAVWNVWRDRNDPAARAILAGMAAVLFHAMLNSLEHDEILWVLIGLSFGRHTGSEGHGTIAAILDDVGAGHGGRFLELEGSASGADRGACGGSKGIHAQTTAHGDRWGLARYGREGSQGLRDPGSRGAG